MVKTARLNVEKMVFLKEDTGATLLIPGIFVNLNLKVIFMLVILWSNKTF